jgi:O-antigen/teichoic acid export membrane protein
MPHNGRPTDATPAVTGIDEPAAPPSQSITRNTIAAVLVQVTTAVFTAVTTLYLIRALGPTSFGVFALALSLMGLAGLVARFGVPQSLARFLADSKHDAVASAGLIRDALHLTIVTATLAGGVLFLAAPLLANAYDQSDLVWPLRAMAISLVAETVLMLYLSVFIALARITVNLRTVFIESLVEAGATIALVAAGTGATGAAFGRATGYTVGVIVAAVAVFRLFGRVSRAAPGRSSPPRRRKDILRYALPLFVIDGIYSLFSQIDVVLIGALLTTTSVGIFAAPKRLMPGFSIISLAVANSVSPRQAPSEGGRYLHAFTSSLRWLTIVYAAFMAPLLIWADDIVSLLFGSDYSESANVIRLLTPYIFLNGVSPLVSTTVNFLGLARQRIPIALGALAINVVIDIILLPRIGIDAAAIGTSAAFLLYVPAHLLICRRHLGLSLRPYIRTVTRALVAAAAMSAVLAAFGREDISLVTATLGSLCGLLAYVAALVVMRELSLPELIDIFRNLRRRAGRIRRR